MLKVELRTTVEKLNTDISDAIKDIKQEMADLEAKIEKQIKTALENPLSNMATTK